MPEPHDQIDVTGSGGARRVLQHRPALLLVFEGACLLAMWRSHGMLDASSLLMLVGAYFGCWAVLATGRPRDGGAVPAAALGACLCAYVVWHLMTTEAIYFPALPSPAAIRAPALLAVVLLIVGWAVPRPLVSRAALLLGAAAFGVYLLFQMLRSPTPVIDVWSICTEAPAALLSGRNPYVETYTDVYSVHGWDHFTKEARFVYLPGLLLHYIVPVMLGLDVRVVHVLAQAGGLLLFASCVGPGRGRLWTVVSGAAVVAFWFSSNQVHLLEFAWTECLLLFYICLAVWAWRRSFWLTAAALILGLSLKQTTWFCMPFLGALAIRERRWRLMAVVAAGVALIIGPFFLWDPAAFYDNTVAFLAQLGPREDALSLGAFANRHAPELFGWVTLLSPASYAAALVCLVVRLWRVPPPHRLADTLAWMTLGLFGLFLFPGVSAFNYYYLVTGLLAFHICRECGERRPVGAPDAASGVAD